MKKLVLSLFTIFTAAMLYTYAENITPEKIEFATETADVWTPTFQLCWDEFINLVGTKQIEYVGVTPELAQELNKQKFDKTDINENSYYISVTKMTKKHKNEIKKAIKEKFNEKSDILDKFEFSSGSDKKTDKWFIYSMLIKKFPFFAAYEILEPDYFNDVKSDKYRYFGYIKKSKHDKSKNKNEDYTRSLYYADDNDFAVKLTDKSQQEEMILCLTSDEKSFDEIYSEIIEKSAHKDEYTKLRTEEVQAKYETPVTVLFNNNYKIPYLKINEELSFDKELAGKAIKAVDYDKTHKTWQILKTLQTVKFDLDNEGAKLKSEAGMAIMRTSLPVVNEKEIYLDNKYYFDRPFVIFLKEKNKEKPYFAARIKDGKYLVKN